MAPFIILQTLTFSLKTFGACLRVWSRVWGDPELVGGPVLCCALRQSLKLLIREPGSFYRQYPSPNRKGQVKPPALTNRVWFVPAQARAGRTNTPASGDLLSHASPSYSKLYKVEVRFLGKRTYCYHENSTGKI